MRVSPIVCVLALSLHPATAASQVRVQVGGGATASSALVTDSILEPIRVRAALAPTVTVFIDGALDSIYRVGFSLSYASSTLRSHSPSGTNPIVTLAVVEPAVRLGRAMGPLDVGLRAGLQMYRAERPVGIFRDGGKVTPTVGADLALRGLRVAGARLGIAAEWSVSRFSTTTLSLSGFTGEQTVQRFGLRMFVAGGPGAQ